MEACRVHITGGSGTGTTTLGRALADTWAVPHADADDYFWQPSEPPFIDKRPVAERLMLMEALFRPRREWVLSGSIMGWGDGIAIHFDAAVFLTLPPDARLSRLRTREAMRRGAAIAPGGSLAEAHSAFMDWARGYDEADFDGRSLVRHEAWLARLACPVLCLDSDRPVQDLVREVQGWMPEESPRG